MVNELILYNVVENSRSSLRDNEPFFIPSLNMPGESEMEPNFSYSSCDHSTSIYPSRFSNYAGDYYSNEPSERDYYRRSTFDVSSRFAGPVDRHRFYSESTLEVGNYRNYLFRPRLNAETHLQFEDVPLYPNSHIQTDSTTSRTFTPMETSLQPSKRTIPKKVSDPLSSQILNPDEIDPVTSRCQFITCRVSIQVFFQGENLGSKWITPDIGFI